jgi:hypothetical protein
VAGDHGDEPASAIDTGIRTTISKVVRPAVSDAPGTAAVPTRADWGSVPLTLRRKPHRASTVEITAGAVSDSASAPRICGGTDERRRPSGIRGQHQQSRRFAHAPAAADRHSPARRRLRGGGHPGADGAGLILLEDGRADTIVASEPFVVAVDQVQYRLGQGPCLSAVARSGTWTCVAGEGAGVVDRGRVVFVVTDYSSCAASWPASFSASPSHRLLFTPGRERRYDVGSYYQSRSG